jgi:hypothetical protein
MSDLFEQRHSFGSFTTFAESCQRDLLAELLTGDFLVGDRTTASRAKSFVPSVSADVAVNALSQVNI